MKRKLDQQNYHHDAKELLEPITKSVTATKKILNKPNTTTETFKVNNQTLLRNYIEIASSEQNWKNIKYFPNQEN